MEEASINLKFDGGDAARHAIDAKLFGQSLQGIDRMVSDALLIFSQQRLPKRGERAPLILKVREPREGSYDVPAICQEASQLLGIGVPIIAAIGPEVISHYVKAVLDYFKGDESAVEVAITKMAEMHSAALAAMARAQKEALEAMNQTDQRRHEEQMLREERSHTERMGMQEILRLSILGSGPAAVDYVAPVGRSVDTATFVSGGPPAVLMNKDDAEAIRESQKLDWQTLANITLRTDGFKFHSSGLSVENPEREGFMMADVNDPAFEEESNAYTLAAQKKAKIEVLARRGYKNGNLAKIQILDFVREVDDHPA